MRDNQKVDLLTEISAALRKVNKVFNITITLKQKNTDLTNLRLIENGKTLVKGNIKDIDLYVAGMLILADLKGG